MKIPIRLSLPLASALPLALAASLAGCGQAQPIPRPASGRAVQTESGRDQGDERATRIDASSADENEAGAADPAPEHAVETEAPAEAVTHDGPPGAISGVVHFKGAPPERRELAIGGTAGCEHDEPVFTETVIVADGKLANVFVYVSKGLKDWEAGVPSEPVLLDQRGCMYQPHVSGAVVGQIVRASNSDPMSHNVHVIAKRNNSPNKTQSAGMKPLDIAFEHEEVPVIFVCDIHPWMKAYVCVQDHPFFAVSGEDGSFAIPGLPPGRYTLTAWHEKYGKKKSGSVTVAPDGLAAVSFEFP